MEGYSEKTTFMSNLVNILYNFVNILAQIYIKNALLLLTPQKYSIFPI